MTFIFLQWLSFITEYLSIYLRTLFTPYIINLYFTFICGLGLKYFAEIARHCMKSVLIRSFSGPHFPEFRLNTERYSGSLCFRSKWRKIRARKPPNTDTFHAVRTLKKNSNLEAVSRSLLIKVFLKFRKTDGKTLLSESFLSCKLKHCTE